MCVLQWASTPVRVAGDGPVLEEPGQVVQRTLPELAKDPRFADAAKAFSETLNIASDEDMPDFFKDYFKRVRPSTRRMGVKNAYLLPGWGEDGA